MKCDQYWPSLRGGTEFYGGIGVTLVDELALAHYTIRTFHVVSRDEAKQERREVRQFQFTAWPDHGVPEHPTPFMSFLRRINACNPPGTLFGVWHLFTAGTLIRAEEGPKVLASPPTAYVAQANFSLAVAEYILGGYKWRHRGNF